MLVVVINLICKLDSEVYMTVLPAEGPGKLDFFAARALSRSACLSQVRRTAASVSASISGFRFIRTLVVIVGCIRFSSEVVLETD